MPLRRESTFSFLFSYVHEEPTINQGYHTIKTQQNNFQIHINSKNTTQILPTKKIIYSKKILNNIWGMKTLFMHTLTISQ